MKYIIPTIVIILLVLAASFHFQQDPPLVVSVGWYEHHPLTTRDPDTGQPKGFYHDLLDEIAKRENLIIEYIETPRGKYLDKSHNAEKLMMAMPIVISDDRRKLVDFSWPVSEITRQLAGRASLLDPQGGIDLTEKLVANLQGTYRMSILEDWLEKKWIGGIVAFETSQEMIDALLKGEVDFIYDESEFIDSLTKHYPGMFQILIDDKLTAPLGYKAFPLRRGEAELLNRINDGMREIMDDGTYTRLYRHYFLQEANQELTRQTTTDSPQERLPAIEINEVNNARVILNDYFNAISNDSDESLARERSGLVDQFIQEGRREFDDKLHRAQVRFNELLLLIKGQPKDAPYFSAFYYHQIYDLLDSFQQMRASIESYRHKFEAENNQTHNNIQMIRQLDIPDPDLQWRKRWVESNFDQVLDTQARWIDRIDETLRKTVEFQALLEETMQRAERDSFDNYRQYYFQRFNFFGHTSGLGSFKYQWVELLRSLQNWAANLPTQVEVVIPGASWLLKLFMILLGCTLAALAFAYWARRRSPILFRRFLIPYLSAGLGIFFAISAQILPMIYYNLFASLYLFSFTLAIMVAVWKLRKVALCTLETDPLVVSIFSLLAIDLLLVFLAPPLVVLAGLVVLTVLNLLWLAYCYRKLRVYRRREIAILLSISGLIWLGSGITAWLGYLYPAMFIAVIGQFSFMVIYAGLIFSHSLLQVARNLAISHPLLTSFISTFLIPSVWLGLLLGAIFWSAIIFNGDWLFVEMYNVDLLPDLPMDISLRLLLNLILAGLLINFLLHWINVLIRILGESYDLDLVSINSTYLVVRYLVWILFSVISLASLNIAWENLKWIIGGLSVGFGFALKDVLENFFAGIIILIGKQVRPGDTIEFGSVYGKVAKINIRATFIKTEDNALIAMPNSQIVSKEFRNWTLNGEQRRQEVEIILAGQTDIQWARQIMLEAMNSCAIVLKDPAADVLFMRYHDNDILLRARFWIQVPLRTKSISVVLEAIDQAFRSRGVIVAIPGLDIRLQSIPPLLQPPAPIASPAG